MKIKYLFFIVISIVLVSVGCKNKSQKSTKPAKDEVIEISVYNMDEIEETYMRFPSAEEILPNLIGDNYAYQSELLTKKGSHNWVEQQSSKRLIMGYYLADLAYLNFYQKPGEYLSYLLAFQELSNELKIKVWINKETINQLEDQDFNMDTIKRISTENYLKMIQTYEEDSDVESLFDISSGLLIELLYLGYNSLKPEDINEKTSQLIAESKGILNFYWTYTSRLKITDQNVVAGKMGRVQAIMEKFEAIPQDNEPQEIDGKTVVGEDVKYVVDKDLVIELTKEISSIRNSIFNNN